VGSEEGLHGGLVHADGRGQHPGADIRQIGQLEEPLDGAVLAVGAVEHDHHHVEPPAELGRQAPGRLGAGQGRLAGGDLSLGAVGQRLLDVAGDVAGRQGDAGLGGQGP
jgi:hypothetical protein